ncbi:MAG: hypothetical protein AB9897_06105 [Anaerolineaceae bacterium]
MNKSKSLIMHEEAIRVLEEQLKKAMAEEHHDLRLIESLKKTLEAQKKWAHEEELKSW